MKYNLCVSILPALTRLLPLFVGDFTLTAKYPDGFGPVGVSIKNVSTNAACPFTCCSLEKFCDTTWFKWLERLLAWPDCSVLTHTYHIVLTLESQR